MNAFADMKRLKRYADLEKQAVRTRFPNGEVHLLSPGQSSVICKAVLEEFAPRYLHTPGLVWLSDRGKKVVDLTDALGMGIESGKNLPGIILVDTGSPELLVVFVEVVATNGAINSLRKQALMEIATKAGFKSNQVTFLTAFADRSTPAFRKASSELAWGSFAWFASEPAHVVVLRDGQRKSRKLFELI